MRKIAVFISVVALTALMAIYAMPASATVVADSGFEGADGNLVHGTATDWNDFSDVSWSGGTAPYRTATASPTSGDASGWTFNGFEDAQASTKDSAFNGGVKQDKDCAIIAGSKAPNKDDIKRIYIANKTVQVSGSPHVMLGLAWVRIPQNTTSPSAHVGFEFNEDLTGTTCPSSNKGNSDGLVPRTPQGFGGTPAVSGGNPSNPGDLLFVYDFEGGSAAPTLTLRHWIDSGTCEISSDNAPCWGVATDLTGSGIAQALVNTTGSTLDQLAPPAGTATTSVDATLGTKEFGEAIVDLTAAHVFSPGVCTGFGQASGVSRSSGNSGSAAMEDLVGPGAIDISNCASVDVTKTADDNSDQSGVVFTLYAGTGTGGTVKGTCTVISDGTCPNDVTGTTPSFPDLQAGTYTVDETTILPGYDKDSTLPYTFTVAAGDALSLPFENAHQAGQVDVSKVDDAGNPVANVVFTLYSPAGSTAGVPDGTAGLSCTTDSTGGCTISDVSPGTYTIDETPPTGYGKDAQFPKDDVVVTDGGTVTINAIDPRLFKIITLVCNQVDSSLYPSSIAVDSGTASNSESGAQIGTLLQTWATAQGLGTLTTAQKNAFQTALCGITAGARGDRRAAPDASNPHSVSVDIPN